MALIGSLTALENELISFEEATFLLFSFGLNEKLEKSEFNNKITYLAEKCLELEDIKELVPDAFIETVNELRTEALELLSETTPIDYDENRLLSHFI